MELKTNTVWGLNGDAAHSLYARVATDVPRAGATHHANIAARWLSLDAVQTAMRAAGVDECFITGDASDFEKLEALLAAMPRLAGHRVARWCAYDLAVSFGCELALTAENAEHIWRETAREMQERAWENADVLQPVSALIWLGRGVKDAADALSRSTGIAVRDLDTLCAAYRVQLDAFAAKGGKMLSLSFDPAFSFLSPNPYHANEYFVRALQKDGKGTKNEERSLFFVQILRFFTDECARRGLTLCLFPERNVPCGEVTVARPLADLGGLAALLQYLDSFSVLPRVLLAARNADELLALAPLCGAFAASDGVARVRPALRISPCFDPDEMRVALARVSGHLPIGALVLIPEGERGILADAMCRVLCSLLCEADGAEDVIREMLASMQ